MNKIITHIREQSPFIQVLILVCLGLVMSVVLGMIAVSIYAMLYTDSLIEYPYIMAKEQPIAFMLVNQIPFQAGMFLFPGIIYTKVAAKEKRVLSVSNLFWSFGLFVAVILLLPFLSDINVWILERIGYLSEALSLKENSDRIIESVTVNQPSSTLIVAILVIAVLTGFAEEFFFRGFIYHHMSVHGASKWLAVIVSAIFFAVLHFNYVQLLPLLCFGIALALIYEFSGSIYTGVTLHALNNALSLIWLHTDSFPGFMEHTQVVYTLVGVSLLIALLWLKKTQLPLK